MEAGARRTATIGARLPTAESDYDEATDEDIPPADNDTESDEDVFPEQEGEESASEQLNGGGVSLAGDLELEDDDTDLEEEESDDLAQDTEGPTTAIRDAFREYAPNNKFVAPLSRVELTGIKLMERLRRKKAPLNAYTEIFEWHLQETGVITDQETVKDAGHRFIGRRKLLKRLAKRYNMNNKYPTERKVRLPFCKEVARIPCFDVRGAIERLLTKPQITADHYNWHNDDPLAPPPPNPTWIEDAITGEAYTTTHAILIDQPNQQLLGVIFYIDGAVTGQFANLPVTALKMSLTCFTREARMKPYCWEILGLIPSIKPAKGRGKKIFQDSGHMEAEDVPLMEGEGSDVEEEEVGDSDEEAQKTEIKPQDFHYMLSIVLQGYVELQATGFIWDLMYKGILYRNLHFVLFCPFVKCDTEEGDILCGKYLSRTQKVKHICRYCHCPTVEADDHLRDYRYKTQTEVEKMVRRSELDKLRNISQQCLTNCWYKVKFNQANERGIHGACPSEMLHALLLGIFKYLRDIFFSRLGETGDVALDINGLASMYGRLLSRQSDRTIPDTNFGEGIRVGRLMARNYRGVLLIIAAVLRSTKGKELMGNKRKMKSETTKADWLLLVETLLQWEAYLNEPKMRIDDVKRMKRKHKYLMYLIKKVAYREKGMGLKIMKFHAIKHIMDDILLYGVPLEVDTGANESHHKPSKYAAQLTQKNTSTFDLQTAIRLVEFAILDLALWEIYHGEGPWQYFQFDVDDEEEAGSIDDVDAENPDQPDVEILTDDTKMRVWYDEEDEENAFEILSKGKKQKRTMLNCDLLEFLVQLQDKVEDHLPEDYLPIYTRHKRGSQIFHGHPNYRGLGPWNDWAIFDWGPGYGRLPCHIHCFVELNRLPTGRESIHHGGIKLKDGVFAVVESAAYLVDNEELRQSEFFVSLDKEVEELSQDRTHCIKRRFYLADTEAIYGPCCVVPDIGGDANAYFLVHPRSDWPKMFEQWLREPYLDMTDE